MGIVVLILQIEKSEAKNDCAKNTHAVKPFATCLMTFLKICSLAVNLPAPLQD